MGILNRLDRFFGSKRRLIELERDIQIAMLKPTLEQRRMAMGTVLRKHDPQLFESIIGADGFPVTDGKTVKFERVRKSP